MMFELLNYRFEIWIAIKTAGKKERRLHPVFIKRMDNRFCAIPVQIAGEDQGQFFYAFVAANDCALLQGELTEISSRLKAARWFCFALFWFFYGATEHRHQQHRVCRSIHRRLIG